MKLQTNKRARGETTRAPHSVPCGPGYHIFAYFDICHHIFALSVPIVFSIFVGFVPFDGTQYEYNVNIPDQRSYSPHGLF